MRVLNPFTYGEKLLSLAVPQGHYTEAKLESMVGTNEININFPKPIWVHLTYQTAFVDPDGKLQFRDDVYGMDRRMIAILKGSDRKVADIAIERPPNQSSKPVRVPVGMYSDGGYNSGPNFFDLLFGGGAAGRATVYTGRAVTSARATAATAISSPAKAQAQLHDMQNAGEFFAGVFA